MVLARDGGMRQHYMKDIDVQVALLTEKQAANLTGFSRAWFFVRRRRNDGPPYIKVGGTKGAVRYDREALLSWFRAQTRQ